MEQKYNAGNFGYGEVKEELFNIICDNYKDERKKFTYLMDNKDIIESELIKGSEKAKKIAKNVLQRVKKNIGYI